MSKNSRLINTRDAFGLLFLVSNAIEIIADKHLSPYKITTKQFFLSLILIQNQKEPLTISKAASLLGTSRQNTKQLALKLEKIGFCKIIPNENDKRILNIEITSKNIDFWKRIDKENQAFLKKTFENLSDQDISSLKEGLIKLYNQIQEEK